MSIGQFFDAAQMALESGGRQFDKSGKPLVGRYRDGSTPPPDKRAYGAGQMQIGTARNVAKAAGIPWDEAKFMSDRQYNLTLAEAHMKALTQKYGDRTIAKAAYHSGEPTVDRAIAKYGRQGFAQGLGPEGRNYIGMGTKSTATPQPSDFLAGVQSRLGPEGTASSAVNQNASPIFNSQPELDARANKVEGVLNQQGDAIATLTQLQDVLHNTQTTAMEQQVQETRAISQQITQGAQELAHQVAPVFQARARIADQLDRVNTMNPLERGLRGIFDLNYDRSYLESQLQHYDTTLEMRAHDYDYMNKLHAAALTEIDRRYSLDTALPKLAVEQTTEDLGTLGISLQQTAGMLGALKDRIGTQTQMIAAQAAARNDMMGQLDINTLTDLAGKARAAGGVIDFNGTKLNYHELRDQIQNREKQDLALQSMQLGIASGKMEFAQKQAENVIQYMTRAEVEGAIAAGGMFKGVQLPADKLTQALAVYTQQGQLAGNSIAQQLPATQVFNMATQAFNQMTQLTRRARGILGADGLGDITHISGDSSQLIQQLTTAVQTNQAPEVINALMGKIAEKQKALSQQIGDRLLRHVGGDKRAAGYLQSFVSGTPMSQGTAVEAITYFALKGGLPQGMGLSDESKQLFKQAQSIIEQNRNGPNGKPRSEKELQTIVSSQLGEMAGPVIGAARSERIMNDLPTIAAKANSPLGKMPVGQFRQARANASQAAATTLARKLNTTPDVVLKMATSYRPVDNTQQAKDLFANFTKLSGEYNALEASTFVQELDDLPQVTPGRRNSSVVQDFLESPSLFTVAQNYGDSLGYNSMGDYIVNPIAVGATEMHINATRDLYRGAQAAIQTDAKANARRQAAAVGFDPNLRVGIILRGIEGVGKEGAAALAPIISQALESYQPSATDTRNTRMIGQEQHVLQVLQSTKFDDPRLEAYRKVAIRGWQQVATQQNSWLESLHDAFTVGSNVGGF